MMLQRPEAKAAIEMTQEAAGDKEAAVTEVAGAAAEAAEALPAGPNNSTSASLR